MNPISIVIAGPSYKEFDIYYSAQTLKNIFPGAELILSSNDKNLLSHATQINSFDKIIACENIGELPSLKFENAPSNTINCNNIKKQIDTSIAGIREASNEIVLKLRTDQIILNSSIINIWKLIEKIPNESKKNRGRIITSSIFSINPRYSERMPYHLSDMFQFGYKEDLIKYYSAPEYPFSYATWYEKHKHATYSNKNENIFRSKYAVEQWLALHYIFENEAEFPILFHNDISTEKLVEFENIFPDYFMVAHPNDLELRASKFNSMMSYVNNQCYSTYDCINLLIKKYNLDPQVFQKYESKGINKKIYQYIKFILDFKIVSFIIRYLPESFKNLLKSLLK